MSFPPQSAEADTVQLWTVKVVFMKKLNVIFLRFPDLPSADLTLISESSSNHGEIIYGGTRWIEDDCSATFSVVTNIRIWIRIRIFSSESRIFGFGFVIFCRTNNIRIWIRNRILTSESESF